MIGESLLMSMAARGLPLALNTRGRQRLTILIYHRVLPSPDYMRPNEPTVEQFSWQMQLLSQHFCPLSLEDALERLKRSELPERAVCVTFDDGYADNAELALPVLRRWNIPATVFVATSFVNGGRMWNDTVIESIRSMPSSNLDLSRFGLPSYELGSDAAKLKSAQDILASIKYLEPSDRTEVTDHMASLCGSVTGSLMVTDEQIRMMKSSGIEIGAHTDTHPILASIDYDEAQFEIAEGKRKLESLLGSPVRYFAYPNGRPGKDFLPAHRDLLPDLEFEAAVTTEQGVASNAGDIFMLPRFTPWDRTPIRFLSRLILNTRNVI